MRVGPYIIARRYTYAAFLFLSAAQAQDSALADVLQAICDLDLADIEAIEPPRGFGRDK